MTDQPPRRATTDDVDAIHRVVAAAFGRYVDRIGKLPAPMTDDYAELLSTSWVWVVEERTDIVGVLVTRAEADHLVLDSVAVSPTGQGGGHGRRLLLRAEQDAIAQGLSEIRLCTNEAMTENLAYYPRHGYSETGRGIQDGYRRVFFAKRLDPETTSGR